MPSWNNLKGSLFAAGRDVSQKAKEVSEVAKLKMDIHTKEDFVEKQFAALGRAYYEANKEDVTEKDAEQFCVIKEAMDEIERMNQQVMDIQGVVQCSNCGKKLPVGNSYCSACGTKLEEVAAEAEIISEELVAEDGAEEVAEEIITEEAVTEEPVVEEIVVEEPAEAVIKE